MTTKVVMLTQYATGKTVGVFSTPSMAHAYEESNPVYGGYTAETVEVDGLLTRHVPEEKQDE